MATKGSTSTVKTTRRRTTKKAEDGAATIGMTVESAAAPAMEETVNRETTEKSADGPAPDRAAEAEATEKPTRRRAATKRTRKTAEDTATDNPAGTPADEAPTKTKRAAQAAAADDDFGAGLDADEKPKTRRRTRRTESTEPTEAAAASTEASREVPAATEPARPRQQEAEAYEARYDDRHEDRADERRPDNSREPSDGFGEGVAIDDSPRGSSYGSSAGTSREASGEPAGRRYDDRKQGGERQGGDDDATGRRRRRRRRRKGGDGPGNQGGPSGGQDRGRRQHGQGGHQGHQGGQGRGRQQQQQQTHARRPRSVEQNGAEVTGTIEGVLELHPKGYGFLRNPEKNYSAQDSDPFVSSSVIEKYGLREGLLIRGDVGPGTKGQGPRLKGIETIDGRPVEAYQKIRHFDELTPINPFEQIKLETGPRPVTMRVMDLLTPIGKGQRALIVAPPRTGKTMLLHDLAHAVSVNHPEMHIMVLLIDERPEEVTEMRRTVRGEVIASSMDREVESHIRISQLLVERAKRIAEAGGEVFLLLDSITRTARAFNKWISSGRTGTGGLDVKAMDIPRKMFGTARRFEEGGSLTILGTALIDTGSRMDDAIFQEFKGTGNMELMLSRDLSDRRIWPAIDISRSGTRREEKLLDPQTLEVVTLLRRSLISLSPVEAMEELTRKLEMFPSNAEFLQKIRNVL